MKTLLVYDSLYGNTEKIARAIAAGLGGDVRLHRATDALTDELRSFDFIIVGSPTHGGRPSQNTQKFLTSLPTDSLTSKRAAAFDTGIPAEGQKFFMRMVIGIFKYAAPRIAASLKFKGAEVLASETFFVLGKEGPLKDGEEERAKEWGRKLL